MTVKEKIIERLERMSEAELLALETRLKRENLLGHLPREEKIKRQLEALEGISGILSDPEDSRAFEEATRRRPLFGRREDEAPTDAP